MSALASAGLAVCTVALPRRSPRSAAAPGLAHPAAQPCKTFRRRPIAKAAAATRPEDEVEAVPPAMLSQLDSEDELQQEAEWVAAMITCWLDEEWPAAELVPVHADLGSATGQAYLRLRQQEGMQEMGDLVLALAAELLSYNFRDTFVNAFDVSNKVVELLMLRDGCDVCCTSEADQTAIARYEAQLAAGKSQA